MSKQTVARMPSRSIAPARTTARAASPSARTRDSEEGSGKNYVAALGRGLAVIRAFGKQREQLTLAEISKLVGLPRATVRRCLITLNTLGYVDTTGKYFRLSSQVLTLSQAYFSSSPLPHIAQPYLEQVSKTLGESCSVSVLCGDEVIYIARSSRKRSASIHRDVGMNLPAYCTSMGRVLLGSLPKADLDAYFRRAVFTKYNHRTVVDKAVLRELIDEARNNGYCIVDGEFDVNLRAIAVPLHNMSGAVVAAVHVSTEPQRTTIPKMEAEFLPALRQAVSQIRRALVG